MTSAISFFLKLRTNKKQTLVALCVVTVAVLIIIHFIYPHAMTSIKENTSQLAGTVNLASLTSLLATESPVEYRDNKDNNNEQQDNAQNIAVATSPAVAVNQELKGPSVIEIQERKPLRSLLPSKGETSPVDSFNLIQKKPSAVVIGTPVCGITPLYTFFGVHPKIAMNDKELNFFSMTDVFSKGVDWYFSQMPKVKEDTFVIERGHHYVVSRSAPERMKEIMPDMKIIYVICDATFRAFAQYLDMIHANDTTKIMINGTVNTQHKAVIYSQYVEHYKRWLNYFPEEQIYLLESDMLLRNPIEEMMKVEEFLGVSTVYNPQHIYFNSSAFTYCVKQNGKNHCLKPNAIAKAPNEFPHEIVYKVREYLRPFSDRLFEMINHKYNWL